MTDKEIVEGWLQICAFLIHDREWDDEANSLAPPMAYVRSLVSATQSLFGVKMPFPIHDVCERTLAVPWGAITEVHDRVWP